MRPNKKLEPSGSCHYLMNKDTLKGVTTSLSLNRKRGREEVEGLDWAKSASKQK